MDLKQVAKDTVKVINSYLTYQAVRIIIAQLTETNPPLAYWLSDFSGKEKIQDGEAYIQELIQHKQDLALRVMTVRQHLAEEVTDFFPEMICTSIAEANIEHRRQHLEKIAQMIAVEPSHEDFTTSPSDAENQAP